MLLRLLATATFLVVSAGAAPAQTYLGTLRGTVRDRGGVVAGATAQLTDQDTGLTRTTISTGAGDVLFARLSPGVYVLRVEMPGFKRYERGALMLGVDAVVAIDIALEAGDIHESVTVHADSPLLETAGGSASTLFDRATLGRLPTAGRNVFVMATTTPTVLATGDSQFVRQQDQSNSSLISLGGGPRRDNSYLLDGVPIVDIQNRATFVPNLEGLDELRVQVSGYDAETGRTSGGVFNAVARSGSNTWHGSGLIQDRPSWGSGRLFFAEKSGLPKPDSYYHLYGGGIGGPIVPNRTFVWASAEGYRSRTNRSTVLRLPTEAQRRGDFSASGVTLYDPLTTRPDPADPTRFLRDPFPGNQIPAGRLNPVAIALLPYLPLPTSGTSRPAEAGVVDAADQITAKLTHRWSDTLTTNGLYAWYGSQEPDARFYGGGLFANGADPGDGALVRGVHLLTLTTVWTVGDRAVLELRAGSNRFLDNNRPAPFDPSGLGFDPALLRSVSLPKFPGISVADYGRGGSLLGDRSQELSSYYGDHASGTLSVSAGRHSVKAGAEWRMTGVSFFNRGGIGSYSFTSDFTAGPNPNAPASGAGDAFASLLLGYPSSGAISTSSPIDTYLQYWGAYVQDDMHVNDRLTVTAGLRYEFEQGLQERDDRMTVGWAFDQPFPIQIGGVRPDGTPLTLTGGLLYAGEQGAPTHQGHPGTRQFAPRTSAAFSIDARTVVRGGYGLFWAPSQGISATEIGTGTRGYNQTTTYLATLGRPFVPCTGCSLSNPFPGGIAQPQGSAAGRLTGVGGPVQFVDPAAAQAHFHRYSIAWQRELPGAARVEIGYLGAVGRDLTGALGGGGLLINQLDPKFMILGTALQEQVPNPFRGTPLGVGILAGETVARGQLLRRYPQFDAVELERAGRSRSRYDALIAAVERRVSHGWGARASYTLSRQLDSQHGESNFFSGGSAMIDSYDVEREYGVSVLDATHQLRLTAAAELPFGVRVSVVASYQSGFPISVLQATNNTGLMNPSQRPDVAAGVDPQLTGDPVGAYDSGCGCIQWLNPSAWTQAAPFTFGSAPRADARVRTPARQTWDVAIDKVQRLGAVRLSIRAEIINLLNAADLRGPNFFFGSSTFGQIREVGGFPRMLQLSSRLTF
jgi:hypothetical protein